MALNPLDILQDAAKGAAVGSVIPGAGTLVGGLVGLASGIVPHLFGDDDVPALAAAAKVAAGGSDDLDTQVTAIAANPAARAAFYTKLLDIAKDSKAADDQAQTDRFKAALSDVGGARQSNLSLVQTGSRMAWATPTVAGILLAAWISNLVATYWSMNPLQVEDAVTLRNLALMVASYYVGSSQGSASKDERYDRLASTSVPAHMIQQPAVIAPSTDLKGN